MPPVESELGAFLRAGRARLGPGDVGFPDGTQGRRVAGLRREEVAVLAGISGDYYTRLEQGRERNPSPQVIEAIGRALRLNVDERAHLARLAGLAVGLKTDSVQDHVHRELLGLLELFPRAAGYVLGPAFDVMATNAAADALLSPFDPLRNMPRILFTHPAAKTVFVEWPIVAESTVHALRLNAGLFPDSRDIARLVGELRGSSEQFRSLWDGQAVGSLRRAFKVFVHPEAGRIELTYQTFDVHDAPGQQLLIGTPAPGSRSEQALTYLTSMSTRP